MQCELLALAISSTMALRVTALRGHGEFDILMLFFRPR